ncbi:MAG: leucine--tRNA ligase, partial [Candidatus Marinimicrobia bacterium]|nr:leucine--tRNA ligase [Candidatus Neomarinimicrobiota bacterium]
CVDVVAKFKKLQGFDVFNPIGWDAFGMHLENYALKIGERPQETLERTTKNFRKQIEDAGIGVDWTRMVNTTTPEYYKWTQWIFTKLFEKGLAFQKESLLHWCPSCKTVLADEQIEKGECERCGAVPEKKKMKQWFFKITDYSERLLSGLDDMDWSEITKSAQKNWIGKSEGALIKFQIKNHKSQINQKSKNQNSKKEKDEEVMVFTTRPDTLFGATYMVLSPEHKIISNLKPQTSNFEEVENYIKKSSAKSDLERVENKKKTGVKLEGVYAVNPVNNEKIPVWVADYVLMGYGTGAIMAVPAHDQRDWEFAKKYELPIIEVLEGGDIEQEAFVEEGKHINSEFLNGLGKEEGIEKMIAWLEKEKTGKRKTNYKLRDWCISRQRYWGPPIPVVHCAKCGAVVVSEKDLPVLLPEIEKGWEPAGDGKGPLASVDNFVNVKCPKCKGEAKRETDVMDNFLDSAWYYYRYLSPDKEKEIFDKELGKKWLPVDFYVGGNEHAVLHLMYTRFITMVFNDLGLIDFDNPFKKFRANGMILKDGKKMSKSKGNVINPEEYGDKIGYDALKTYLLFLGPLEEDRSFSDDGVIGAKRWVEKIFRLQEKVSVDFEDNKDVVKKLHSTIKQVEEDLENQKYNTAIARLMEMTNLLTSSEEFSKETLEKFIVMVAPFVPALAEEIWEKIGNKDSIFASKNWPEYDESKITEDTFELVVQINGKLRGSVVVAKNISQEEAEKIVIESGDFDKYIKDKEPKKIIFVGNKLINLVV